MLWGAFGLGAMFGFALALVVVGLGMILRDERWWRKGAEKGAGLKR